MSITTNNWFTYIIIFGKVHFSCVVWTWKTLLIVKVVVWTTSRNYKQKWTDFQSAVLARVRGLFYCDSAIYIQTKPETPDWSQGLGPCQIAVCDKWRGQNLSTSYRVLFRSRQTDTQTQTTSNPRLAESKLWPTIITFISSLCIRGNRRMDESDWYPFNPPNNQSKCPKADLRLNQDIAYIYSQGSQTTMTVSMVVDAVESLKLGHILLLGQVMTIEKYQSYYVN